MEAAQGSTYNGHVSPLQVPKEAVAFRVRNGAHMGAVLLMNRIRERERERERET